MKRIFNKQIKQENIKTDTRKLRLKRIKRNYTLLSLTIVLLLLIICINTCINIRRNKITKKAITSMSNALVNMENDINNMIEPNNITLSKGTVMGIDTFEDTVTVIDTDGHAYSFYGVEDWIIKDGCIMLVDSNGTDTRKDDVVLDVLYDER